jgi:uncharacterized membrane protein YfcA
MAQYKLAMARMYGVKSSESFDNSIISTDISSQNSVQKNTSHNNNTPSFFEMLKNNDKLILNLIVPIIWCFGIVLIMDRKSFIETLYMPFLGIFAAFIANCVPLGGGIVYIPAFYLIGVQMKLGVAFTVATMTIGNGVFGLLRWLRKDSSLIIWEAFQFTVLPSYLGTIVAVFFLPSPSVQVVRKSFALFCTSLGVFMLFAVYKGGLAELVGGLTTQPQEQKFDRSAVSYDVDTALDLTVDLEETKEGLFAPGVEDEQQLLSEASWSPAPITDTFSYSPHASSSSSFPPVVRMHEGPSSLAWVVIAVISFLAGLVLVPNIGMGPALTTFLALALVGYRPERAIVTGILAGGWASIVPFAIHLFYYNDVPYRLWIMVIPGIFFGAKVSSVLN